jgi:outer membrane autotransporter protein
MTTIIISSGAGVIGGNGGDGGRNGISGSATNYGGNGGSGIANSGAIGALVISGSVTGGSGGNVGRNGSGTDGTDGAGLANSGTIDALSIIGGTVTGGGTAYGISNSGTIRSLTNSQSGLTYSGILPTTYQTYFTTAGSYGSVVFNATSGSLAYGLAKASGTTYAVGTYANVIESNVALTFSLLALNRVTYALSQVSRCSTATYCYDLTISSVTPWSAVGEGAGGQAGRLGAALDRIAEAGGLSAPLARLDALSPAGQAHALKQMAASGLVPSLLSGGTTLIPSNSAIGGRLDMAMAAGGATGASAGDAVQRGVLWGQVLGNHAGLDNSSAGDGFSSDAFGLLVGADTDIADNAVAGVAVNWLRAVAQGKSDSSGNSIIVDVYQLSLYGAWRPEGRAVWTQGVASVGLNRYDQKRAIDYLGETAAARFQGRQMQAKVSGGYDFPLDGGLTVTPQASLQVSRVQNQGYTETGSAMGQAVRSQGFNSVESVIGGKLAYTLDTDQGGLNADVQAGWRHDYVASPIVTAADLGGVGYTIATARLPSNGAQVGLGAGLRQGDELSFRLEYDGDLRDGYASHTGLLRVRQSL